VGLSTARNGLPGDLPGSSKVTIWLFRWLLFPAGVSVGLCENWPATIPSWRGLSALSFHYQTQPLHAAGRYAQQLPAWFPASVHVHGVSWSWRFRSCIRAETVAILGRGWMLALQILIPADRQLCVLHLLAISCAFSYSTTKSCAGCLPGGPCGAIHWGTVAAAALQWSALSVSRALQHVLRTAAPTPVRLAAPFAS